MAASERKNRNVLVIAYSFPPRSSSGSIRNDKLLRNLSTFGWNLQVLTVKEKYFLKTGSGSRRISDTDNIEIIRTNCFYTQDFVVKLKNFILKQKTAELPEVQSTMSDANDTPLKKITKIQKLKDFITDFITVPDKNIGWFPFALVAGIKIMRKGKVNLIYAIGKPWTGLLIGYSLKLIYKKPLVIDFMDPWMGITWRWSKGNLLDKIQFFLEKLIVKRSDFIIANTEELGKDFIERLKVSQEKTGVITCGYDEDDFNENIHQIKDEQFVITHTGSFYSKRNPINFLKAVKQLTDNKLIPENQIRINFIGALKIKDPALLKLIAEPPFTKILHMESWVPHSKAIEYLYLSDVLFILQPDTFLQIPAKLYEYIFTQKPILAIAQKNGALDNIIKNEGWGKTIENNDIEGIADTVSDFYQEFKTGNLKTKIDEKSIQSYSVKSLAYKLGCLFEEILNRR
ncbi:MAG: glycosyltransferase family 4 protein [Desulfobacteraceae bacterium]|nr:glycosyltransferase family 4 protein [Desulfobacteraceae bacterium]